MKTKVLAGAHPWIDSWNILIANSHSSSNYVPSPTGLIVRGTGNPACSTENYSHAYNDAAAAYQLALRWKISGDVNYANAATNVLNQWSSTCTNLCGDSNADLAAGLYGYEFACAAEIMRSYNGWTASDFVRFQSFMLNVFYPVNHDFLIRHNNTCDTHYWANWDLCNMDSMLAIGVLCDSRTIYSEAINYFKTGIGNGAANQVIYYMHPGYMGQWQEAGRDQGHCTLGPALLGPFCEIAWNQGDDLYGYNTNLFLAGSEYVAKYNVQPLVNTVPYVGFCDCESDVHNVISSASQGTVRPGWEMVYNHYVNRKGLSATYTAQMAAQVRPEGGGGNYGGNSGGFDQLGFTTLTHTLDPIATNAVPLPGGLRADVRNNTVTLSWWGSAYASSYNVKRATASGGPYTNIASGLAGNLYYTDVGLLPGTNYFYVVSAVVGGVESSNSLPVSATADTRLTGTVIGSPGSYNNLGATITKVYDGALGSFYDAANGSGDWAGLDLGVSNVITQIKYCPRVGFASRMVGGQFQGANVADFSSGVVTLFTVTSAPADTWPETLTSQTINNANAFRCVRFIGPASGSCNVSEVQFFGYASSAGAPAAPTGLNATPGNAQVRLNWAASPGATSFNVKRSLVSGGPYANIVTGIRTTTCLDPGVANFTNYYYVVSALNATGEGANSAEVVATPHTAGLVSYLNFNETGGTTASDSTGNGWNGTLVNGATFVAGYSSNAVSLSSASSQHVTMPAGVVASLTNFTVAAWVKLNSVATWNRIFDFGTGTTVYMFLSPQGGSGVVRFAITTGGGGGEEQINGTSALPTGSWHHVAVTLLNDWGVLYVDGAPVGTNIVTLNPSSLGSTTNNYIGKSQYPDPYLNGLVDEFRIYNGALSASDIASLAAGTPGAPTGLTAAAGDSLVALNWNTSANANSYCVKRSTTNGGMYAVAANVAGPAFTNTGLANGMVYYFVVTAANVAGESANSFQVSARPVSAVPPQLTSGVSGSQLQFAWPADHTGWMLQMQTNSLSTGLGTNWVNVTNSMSANQLIIQLSAANGSGFFRLVYP